MWEQESYICQINIQEIIKKKKPHSTAKIILRPKVKVHSLKMWLYSNMKSEIPTEIPFSRNNWVRGEKKV